MEEKMDKGIDELLDAFEIELQEETAESKSEVERVKYYGSFNINGIEFQNIFIMTEKDESGKTIQHIYSGNTSNEILTVDENGNVEIKSPDLQSYLGKVDFEKTITENDSRLKAISEQGTPEEIKKALNPQEQENDEKDNKDKTIEDDMGEDLGITNYREINDRYISKKIPEVFGRGEEDGIAYSSKLNRFVIVSKINGKYQINDQIEPAKTIKRTVISVDEKGEKVETNVPYALMKIPNNPNKEIAVTIGQYGYIDIETIDIVRNTQQRIARAVRTGGEEISEEEDWSTRRVLGVNATGTEGVEYNREFADGIDTIGKDTPNDNGQIDNAITEDDYIPGTQKTWGELMEATGESLPKLIERFNREMDANGKESEQAIETIEDDYGMVSREHKH